MSSLNIASNALTTNLAALQIIGHNIANVNTEGYSRQNVNLAQVPGQLFGNGYYGKGVEIASIERTYNAFLTREANLSASVAAADEIRYSRLQQLEELFPMGDAGMGTQLNNFLNSWADVVASPTDQTARGVVLTTAEEIAARFRDTADQLEELRSTTRLQIESGIGAVNRLAQDLATLNQRIVEAYGAGKSPNDLLDQRDQLIGDLNQYVQTKTLVADDKSMTVFVAGSYPLVLGSTAYEIVNPPPADEAGNLSLALGNEDTLMNTDLLGGGQLQGLLRFYNDDVNDVSNQLGRLALSMMEATNRQLMSGLDLNGNPGQALFGSINFSTAVVAEPGVTADLSLAVDSANASAASEFKASNYVVSYTGASQVQVQRTSDGLYLDASGEFTSSTPVNVTFPASPGNYLNFDGLRLTQNTSGVVGDQVLLRPFSDVAEQMRVVLTSPSQLAIASPVYVQAGANNAGTLEVASISRPYNAAAEPSPYPEAVITFNAAGQYSVTLDGVAAGGPFDYTSGQPIQVTDGSGYVLFELNLRGAPSSGDTFSIDSATEAGLNMRQNTGNGQALLALRDLPALDGYTLSDGYIPVFSAVASSIQTAKSAAEFSAGVAESAESSRANAAGVNLDEEAARLLQFQQAYQAAAKYLQTVQSTFDTLLQSFG